MLYERWLDKEPEEDAGTQRDSEKGKNNSWWEAPNGVATPLAKRNPSIFGVDHSLMEGTHNCLLLSRELQ